MNLPNGTIETKYLEVDNVTLAYKEANPQNEITIFFIHGNSCSSTIWEPQLKDELFSNYRLVAFDLPAHGKSSAHPEDKYGVQDLGNLLAKAVKQLSAHSPYFLAALSMGANILTEMLNYQVLPLGIILIGPTIIGDEFHMGNIGLPGLDPTVLFTDEADDQQVVAYYSGVLLDPDEKTLTYLLDEYKSVKLPFRSVLIGEAIKGNVSNELQLLRNFANPVLIIFGKDETVVNPNYLDHADVPKWSGKVQFIEKASHLVSLEQPEELNNVISEYANERTTEYLFSLPGRSVPTSS